MAAAAASLPTASLRPSTQSDSKSPGVTVCPLMPSRSAAKARLRLGVDLVRQGAHGSLDLGDLELLEGGQSHRRAEQDGL